MSYNAFSEFYDELMADAEYEKRTEYVLRLFQQFDKCPSLLLDLACGSGEFTYEFSKRGIEVIGVDQSFDMLNIARGKLANTLFLQQNAEELDLYGTVDGAVCLMDSLNHITDYDTLCRAISRVSLFLEPERLFIFDVNTEFKHREILANNAFLNESENVMCCWQNFTDENLKTDIYLDFFVKEDSGLYRRESDEFSEQAYSENKLRKALDMAGLEVLAIYDDLSENPQSDTSERVFYITRKVK